MPIWLVSGPPGAGKTSVAGALCRRFEKAVHIPVDDLRDLVRSGRADPIVEWTAETELQFVLARRSAARMAADYSLAGFAVVIDDLVTETHAAHFTPHLGEQTARKVLLLPAAAVADERNRTRRNKAFDTSVLVPHVAALWAVLARENTPDAGWLVVDSSALTVEETVDRIVAAS